MTSSVPWSVKGIDRKARETAKDLARRSGMTLGEWLNHVIEYQGEGKVTPLPQTATINEAIERLTARIEAAETRSTLAVTGIDQSVRGLAARLEFAEKSKTDQAAVGVPAALKSLETSIGRIAAQVYENEAAQKAALAELRDELGRMSRRVDAGGGPDSAGVDNRLTAMEAQIAKAEQRSTKAIEGIGHQVLRMADTVQRQVEGIDLRTSAAVEKIGGDVARLADQFDQRFSQADAVQAQALEKLGAEIERITERLTERINQSELRAAQAIDGVRGEAEPSVFADRIRDSETRTAYLLDEARETIGQRLEELRPQAEFEHAGEPEAALDPFAMVAGEDPFAESGAEPARASADVAPAPTVYPDEDGERTGYAFAPQDFQILGAAEIQSDAGSEESAEAIAQEAETFAQVEIEAADPFAPAGEFEADPFAHDDPFSIADDLTPPTDGEDPFAGSQAEAAPVLADDADEAEAFEPGPFGRAPDPDAAAETLPPLDAEEGEDEFVGAEPAASEEQAAPSRLEFIERARAAARAASQDEAKRGKGGFTLQGLGLGAGSRRRGGAKLKSGLLMSTAVLVCLGSGLVGAAMLAPLLKEAATPKLTDKTRGAQPPRAAVMTDPQPIAAADKAAIAETPVLAPTTPIATAKPADPQASMIYAESLSLLAAKDKRGVEMLKKAADLGYPQAQLQLGHLYESGYPGLAQDLVQARRWTEKAAEAGLPSAMHNLAMLIYNGEGGPKSQPLAAQWFRQAAELGQVDSQFNLGLLYENGKGVHANPAEAYKWFLLATRGGDSQSRAEARTAAQRVRPLLSAEAQAAAERAAQAYGVQASAN
jgi:localization factor PodJL